MRHEQLKIFIKVNIRLEIFVKKIIMKNDKYLIFNFRTLKMEL